MSVGLKTLTNTSVLLIVELVHLPTDLVIFCPINTPKFKSVCALPDKKNCKRPSVYEMDAYGAIY